MKLAESTIVKKRDRGYKASEQSRAHGENAARELLGQALGEVGLTAGMLAALPGSDQRKVQVAALIKERTTVSMAWIAEALQMKSAANASQQIRLSRLRARGANAKQLAK